MFWYGCPHCNRFQPYLEPWIETLPDHVRFVRMPAIFDEVWELHARAYYIADALGVLDDLHREIFAAMHDGGRSLATMDAIRAFFVEHGWPGTTSTSTPAPSRSSPGSSARSSCRRGTGSGGSRCSS